MLTNNKCLEQAKEYQDRGWVPIPVASRGKEPLIRGWTNVKNGGHTQLEKWAHIFPECNFGISTGKSNLVVIDIDPKNGGNETLAKLIQEHGEFPETPRVRTGTGGLHYYFAAPDDMRIPTRADAFGAGVDIRAAGGQAVAPPSIHPNGNSYEWENNWRMPLAPLPQWMKEKIEAKSRLGHSKHAGDMSKPLVEGSRNETIYTNALALARQNASRDFVVTTMKTWRDTEQQNDITDREIERTVESAFKHAEETTVQEARDKYYKSDRHNAERLYEAYHDSVIYVKGLGWHIWDGTRWVMDDDDSKIISLASDVMLAWRNEVLESIKDPSMDKRRFDSGMAMVAWTVSSQNNGRLSAMVDLAKGLFKRLEADEMNPPHSNFLLNFQNGTLDLKTGELRSHNPEDLITRIIKHNYNPDAECSFWEHTLRLALDNDQEMVDFVQRGFGYSISGSTAEQCFFVCWGKDGNNGKSTILEAVGRILDKYANSADPKFIISGTNDNFKYSVVAKLAGARFVNTNELEEKDKLNETTIKQITGGDTVQACKKFKEPFEYRPIYKLWMRTNEKPRISGTNTAIWRRVMLVPFDQPIPPHLRKSRDYVDEMLDAEAEGILAWMVRGFQEWQKQGLNPPEKCTAAVNTYKAEMDVVTEFLNDEEWINKEVSNGKVVLTDLTAAINVWLADNGHRYRLTSRRIVKRLNEMGYEVKALHGNKRYALGFCLTEEAEMHLLGNGTRF
jgi:putative DNA primase/helicase